jgi:histidine triad (HIT) family protein
MPIRLPDMDPCYFCDIIGGSTERWNVVEETALTLTMLNGRQFEVGQCIVVPVRHAPTLLDLRVEEEAAVMAAARRAARALINAFDPDGVLLYQNNGVGSGQEVPHFHLHVVPRRPGSDLGFRPSSHRAPRAAVLSRRSCRHHRGEASSG